MVKITAIQDINIRANGQVINISNGDFVEVSEATAVYLCNEDIEAMSASEQRLHSRRKKAIRTTQDNINNPHTDYSSI